MIVKGLDKLQDAQNLPIEDWKPTTGIKTRAYATGLRIFLLRIGNPRIAINKTYLYMAQNLPIEDWKRLSEKDERRFKLAQNLPIEDWKLCAISRCQHTRAMLRIFLLRIGNPFFTIFRNVEKSAQNLPIEDWKPASSKICCAVSSGLESSY